MNKLEKAFDEIEEREKKFYYMAGSSQIDDR
jgi:hypothetical protein